MSLAPTNIEDKPIGKENQYIKNISEANRSMRIGKSFSGHEPNCVFRNAGDGTFETISALSGFDFTDDSRGLATTDLNNDGKVDFWVSNRNAPRFRFMLNNNTDHNNWIGFTLKGDPNHNRDAIGARITIKMNNGKLRYRTLRAGDGFASQSSKRLLLGLGKNTISELTITWPDGSKQQLNPPAPNQYYSITKNENQLHPTSTSPKLTLLKPNTPSPTPSPINGKKSPLHISIPFPTIPYKTTSGTSTLAANKLTKPTLISLWDPNCEFCKKELKEFSATYEKWHPTLNLIALTASTNQEAILEFLLSIQPKFITGQTDANTSALLATIISYATALNETPPTPTHLLLNIKGEIVAIYRGNTEIDTILADTIILAKPKTTPAERINLAAALPGSWITKPTTIDLLYIPRTLFNNDQKTSAAEYSIRAQSQLSHHKEFALFLNQLADNFKAKKQLTQAAQFYYTAATYNLNDQRISNNIAWFFATQPDPKFRNAKIALIEARKAAKITNFQDPSYLDTLAAAYAENQNFPAAITTIHAAIKLTSKQNNPQLLKSLQISLLNYKNSKPTREP